MTVQSSTVTGQHSHSPAQSQDSTVTGQGSGKGGAGWWLSGVWAERDPSLLLRSGVGIARWEASGAGGAGDL